MEPGTPTSFIPKRPVASEPVVEHSSHRSVGLLSLITIIIVLGTALSYGALYLYKGSLTSQKGTLDTSINDAQNEIGSEFVSDMKRLNDRIDGVKELIKNHVVVTPIFDALQSTTLRSVQYKTFGYTLVTDTLTRAQTVAVSITGTAKSYSTIALQSDAFSKNSLIKNPVFSNLSVNDRTNTVDFKLAFDVSIDDLSFEKFVKSLDASSEVTGEQP
jgi:hypothetical protein